MSARTPATPSEPAPPAKEVSPPPVAPSAPAFGSVPNRSEGPSAAASAAAKVPPTAPRAYGDRQGSQSQDSASNAAPGPDGNPAIPVGPKAQQQKPLRPSSKQWINPNLKKGPESPKMSRAQPPSQRPGGAPADQSPTTDDKRPRSSDSKADAARRASREQSAEPGEIMPIDEEEERAAKEKQAPVKAEPEDRKAESETAASRKDNHASATTADQKKPKAAVEEEKPKPVRQRKAPVVKAVRFAIPPETSASAVDQASESDEDDDEDMDDYFNMEIEKTEAELSKLQAPELPLEVVARFASMSHGAMVRILNDEEGLVKMMGDVPDVQEPVPEPTLAPTQRAEEKEKPEREAKQEKEKEAIEKPVEKPSEKPAEKPVEEPAKEPVKEPVKETVKETVKEPVKEPTPPSDPKVPEKEATPAPIPAPTSATEEAPAPEPTAEPAAEAAAEPEPMEEDAIPAATPGEETEAETQKPLPTDKVEPEPAEVAKEEPEAESRLANLQLKPDDAMDIDKDETVVEPETTAPETTSAPAPEPEPTSEPAAEPAPTTAEPPVDKMVTDADTTEKKTEKQQPVKPVTKPQPTFTSTDKRVGELPTAEQILPVPSAATLPLETPDSASKPPSTPSQVEDEGDDDETESDEEAYVDVETVRQYADTPPINSLPTLAAQPWHEDKDLLSTFDSDPAVDDYILQHLQTVHLETTTEQEKYQKKYADNYAQYLKFAAANDPIATKGKEKSNASAAQAAAAAAPESRPEGGRSGRRFGSERDLERVLQASMREADEMREREERIQREKHRGDKEAVIPDMYWTEDEKQAVHYIDRTGYTPTNRLVAAWQVLPPVNNFTEEEAELFEKRYLEAPKQWGRIADAVPNRDFGTCIQYYYLMKKELNLKDKLRRQPKRRKKGGRGKQRSSALVSELGNADAEGAAAGEHGEHHEGENGESRRRPRRAAAPTWGFEQPAADNGDGTGTPATTPGGRRGGSNKGDGADKPDGRRGRRKGAKDKEAKNAKNTPNQTLAAAGTQGSSATSTPKSRGRSDNSNKGSSSAVDFQQAMSGEVHRLPTHFEQQQPPQPPQQQQQLPQAQAQQRPPPPPPPPAAATAAAQPFPTVPPQHPHVHPHQQPLQQQQQPPLGVPPAAAASIVDVMTAPPSLRPEPPAAPPQPAMTTFNLAQAAQPERKAQAQASSYWSVSESTDFPLLLAAFGSDWTAIASHMGSKTAVMVSTYTRTTVSSALHVADNENQVKNYYVRQKDAGKADWEDIIRDADAKRARGEKRPDPPQPSTGGRGRRYDSGPSSSSRPLAAAPGATALELAPEPMQQVKREALAAGQPPPRGQPYPGFGVPIAQAPSQVAPPPGQPGQKPLSAAHGQPVVTQSMSPGTPSLRAPPLGGPYGMASEREQEAQRHMASGPPPAHPHLHPDAEKMEAEMMQQRYHQQQQHQQRERERVREREVVEMEMRDREMARQTEIRAKQESEMASRHYEAAYGGHHRQPSYPPPRDVGRGDPLSLSRHPQEPPRHSGTPVGAPQPYPTAGTPVQQQPYRSLLADPSPAQSPPPLAPPVSRPMSALQHRQSGSVSDIYRAPTPQQSSTPVPPSSSLAGPPPPRPAEPRKSNIMSLLNDDPAPPPKRVNDVSTPPPQSLGRAPPPQQQPPPPQQTQPPPSHLRRESEVQYSSPYSRPPSTAAVAMPSLKPTAYSASPGPGSRSSLGMAVDSPAPADRDYYRGQAYPPPPTHPRTDSPAQQQHRYAPPAPPQASQPPYQAQAGYPTPYGSSAASQPPPTHVSSPPPPFPLHSGTPGPGRSREPPPAPPQSARDAWPQQGQPGGTWAAHPNLRDERVMYGSQPGRYAPPPPPSRGPPAAEPVPPPGQAYPCYASTPQPRDPRDMGPSRSYTPVGAYDARAPPPPGHAYPPPQGGPPDPRDLQLRDGRDPRDVLSRGLRPQGYDRHDPYGR